jgi:hypothetical protein
LTTELVATSTNMPKLTKSTDWHRLAKAQASLESMGLPATAATLARHLSEYAEADVKSTLDDLTYQEFAGMYKQRRFGLWAETLSKAGAEIQHLMKTVGFKALLTVDDCLDSEDDKVRIAAARLAFDFNPDMERPVIRHEITSKFSSEELQQARDIVNKLKKPSLPELPNGEGTVVN